MFLLPRYVGVGEFVLSRLRRVDWGADRVIGNV
jgi:hypothetical protein